MDLPADLPIPDNEGLRTLLQVDLSLLELNGLLVSHWNSHAAAHGVTSAQIKLILCLQIDDAMTMRALAKRLNYDASNLTTLTEKLQDRRLINRTEDSNDKRRKSVRLTKAGLKLRNSFWQSLTSDAGPLASLTQSQLVTLRDLLDVALRS